MIDYSSRLKPYIDVDIAAVHWGWRAACVLLCVLLVMFFRESRWFPRVFYGYGVLNLGVMVGELGGWLTDVLMPVAISDLLMLIPDEWVWMLWAVYLWRSRRVKATFVR